MAKKSDTEHKVDLGEVLENIDLRNLSFYDSLDEDQKKALSPFVAMKFASSIDEKSKLDIKYHYISMANTVNVNLWNISAHKKLQWLLLSIMGINKKMFHPQIPFVNSKVSKTKIDLLLEKKYPDANKFELKILKKKLSKSDIIEIMHNLGWQDHDMKDTLKEIEKIYG